MSERAELIRRIRALSAPCGGEVGAIGSRVEPVGMRGVRAVVFDVYGTLMTCCGRVGEGEASARIGEVLVREGLADSAAGLPGDLAGRIRGLIAEEHARLRRLGVDYPEVEIREIWSEVLGDLERRGMIRWDGSSAVLERVAVEVECRVNPVWPVAGLARVLAGLRGAGYRLGILSNAQFMTPLLFPALLGESLEACGFDPGLCVWSHEVRRAKPSLSVYGYLGERAARYGLGRGDVLMVGDDVRNDVWAARSAGFRAALVAGGGVGDGGVEEPVGGVLATLGDLLFALGAS